jgi:beta-carotene 3-hydroxylase
MSPIVFAVAAFVAMECVATVSHRCVMHGRGFVWHAAHHRARTGAVDANDLFPLLFAVATIAVIAVGSAVRWLHALTWIGAGVTAYGAAYFVVHDVCIHGRALGRPVGRRGYLAYVRRAHRVHHATGAEPFGFLLPVLGRRRGNAPQNATESLRPVGTDARRAKTS